MRFSNIRSKEATPVGTNRWFFSEAHQDTILDSQCSCGHMEGDHGSQMIRIVNGCAVRVPHSGNCCVAGCKCNKFCFEKLVTVEDLIVRQELPKKPKRGLMPA